jgi:transglutaminase-like putative cysteine protease
MNTIRTTTTNSPAINTRHAWRPVLKPIASLVVFAQFALVLQPLSAMAQDKGQAPINPQAQAQMQRFGQFRQAIEQAKARKAKEQTPADKASERLERVQELVQGLRTGRAQASASRRSERLQELREHLQNVDQEQADVRAEFEATGAELRRKGLPAQIIQRHEDAKAQFEQKAGQYRQIAQKLRANQAAARTDRAQAATQSIATGDEDSAVQELDAFFVRNSGKGKPAVLDPKKLPWSTPKPNLRAPAETKTAWYQHLYADQKIRLAQAGGTSIGPLQFDIAPEPSEAPTPADLAQTDEIQFTPAIRAKAIELNNNPVAIYNWVHNNIDFAPSAGAIQSAQDTFDKKRGNATDTASLLIALLRAAKIPARYQFGTVDIPSPQVQNWVGGMTKPEAALQLLNQGGIAARGLRQGAQLTFIRMEHVWVNAYVNWMPSRGNRNATATQHPNPNADLNEWVPLDGSFKQYSYTAGMNLATAVPVDAQALLDAAKQGATFNDAQGWAQNLNQTAVQGQLEAYQSRLKTYVASTPKGTSTTIADAFGRKIIPQQAHSVLEGRPPYVVTQQATEASVIPSALQHKFSYRLYASDADQVSDNPLLAFTEKTSKLVGKPLTLSYAPASQADAETMASYFPQPHPDGSALQPSEMPTSLPAYLIRLQAQIRLDGQIVAQSSEAVQMGTALYSTGGFTQLYDTSQWDLTSDNSNVAGQGTAIGISAGGVSATQLVQLGTRLTTFQSATPTLPGLAGGQAAADILTANIWTWFARAEGGSQLTQNVAGIAENPGLSYGLFHALIQPVYSWGIVRKATFPGLSMDVGHVRNLSWAKDNTAQSWVTYNRTRGTEMSALEHEVPEQLLSNPAQCSLDGAASNNANLPLCPQAFSAVRALNLAAQAGQKIYTITSQVYARNPAIVQNALGAQSESTRTTIQQAVDAGYEVTVHEAPIAKDGWRGAGFIVIDPATGAGGYLIEGGSNGALLIAEILGLIVITLICISSFPGIAAAALVATAAIGLTATLAEVIYGLFLIALLLKVASTWIYCSDDETVFQRIAVLSGKATIVVLAAMAGGPLAAWLAPIIEVGPFIADVIGPLKALVQIATRLTIPSLPPLFQLDALGPDNQCSQRFVP